MINKTPIYVNGELKGECSCVKLSQDQNGIDTIYTYHVDGFEKKGNELSVEQQHFLEDIEQMWSELDKKNLSCKTSAIFEVLDSGFDYEVYGEDIDDVVRIFMDK
ncbi:hypothetical protein [Enterococcus pallens]|uniref:Uncharacterized protein n=1 Tax=Enterococcus pallens ATCC BAA-351 TaxID=1158607 RepID=R2T3I7_9ENTE|nr:hypothetical protein [Enterococcus pallens]EOH94809.1 hypothetical protein UAU_01731 [Enterococcus pallens ATCC BAA-351]EOU14872.1 hypothetical protein I588_04522 [Enterococcus pallens ATCC BAA-351]OJG67784.1 hypothetical protein RV10_GL001178 [Enterococcus pallens]